MITVRTSLDELRTLRAFTHGFNRKELAPGNLLPDIWHRLPEIGIDSPYRPPSPDLTIIPVERHLPWDVYAHLLGISAKQYEKRATNGDFGPAASDATTFDDIGLERPWWNSSEMVKEARPRPR
ncbi:MULTISPECIES: hypothetical protein [unclassified Pseudonocardia]|uniref:hypothetical protein n=1 Tax=unclassified Pseudonocardia TaxID=2619320 RepID=UPI001115407F|nr:MULTISPECIES: hypothetical protein [unclassified Pseudonocardia]